ncbi:glycosyl transferase [Plectosphaerella plurivora]|uniref:Glycosyl transferase n=1 Tax=Plectosphaerella plurivora TaxID=936078 RepID=A0A9P8V399_9PEZI|nr:glycosyl transferase [Plectosphaerella plurivora]
MANPIVPGLGGLGGGDNETLFNESRRCFPILCSEINPSSTLFDTWYQTTTLAIGATAIVIPILLAIIYSIVKSWGDKSPKGSRKRKHGREESRSESEHAGPIQSFRWTKSFRVFDPLDGADSSVIDNSQTYDLVVFPLGMQEAPSLSGSARCSLASGVSMPAKMSLARVDVDSLGADAIDDTNLDNTADALWDACFNQNVAGLALRCSLNTKGKQLEKLLAALYTRRISSLLLCNHDWESLDKLDLQHASGLIIENACILPDGQRRDYFQSRRLRETMTRCTKEREERAEFFVGFLDQWNVRPHPSVVKRAVKLAEHFGAVFEHGPIDALRGLNTVHANASRTIGAFEYLRRAEVVDMQQVWSSESMEVDIHNGKDSEAPIAPLPIEDLKKTIPTLAELLTPKVLSSDVIAFRDTNGEGRMPPNYMESITNPADFWDSSMDGMPLATMGCFPIGSEPTAAHFNAIVETQDHLRELRMLHPIEGNEEQRLLASLRLLADHPDCCLSVHDLIKGLRSHEICVYKGLDTGFRSPEGSAFFWGVSKGRDASDANCVDIYVSQKSPSDAAVVLHSWLAHQGRTRAERFEHELLLEKTSGRAVKTGIPTGIQSAIEEATPAELLLLRQKIRQTAVNHPLADAIKEYTQHVLIDESSRAFWSNLCARKVLDGTLSMRDILRMRLEYHVRQGATELPALEDLVHLYGIVSKLIEDALFFGERSKLIPLTRALLKCYGPSVTTGRVDINADMFALIFFSVLRKSAFEDVYLETTDRCPLFLSHPDQAAVFSELWILGSQCENYFGLSPREVGNVIYHRYNRALAKNPPTAEDRKGTEIMTMYSSTDSSDDTEANVKSTDSLLSKKLTNHERMELWKTRFSHGSAITIFCGPAVLDVILLTFVGRGLFMTAFMGDEVIEASGYALLTALLLTAGVTGWVGSTGNYYLPHYAYDSMILFHVQRLSGGFVLASVIGIGGLIGFSIRISWQAGLIFAAYLILVSTYLNLLGVMSTMHQHASPLHSGRNVFLTTVPILFVSPILSSFVTGYDLAIYLSVMFVFLIVILWRYRRLCHQWSAWMTNIPTLSAPMIVDWYKSKMDPETSDEERAQNESQIAEDSQLVFAATVHAYIRRSRDAEISDFMSDPLVAKVAHGLPYIDWLFKKPSNEGEVPELFTTAWFTKLGDAIHQQRQLSRGLKDHNVLMLFRQARFDLGQNLGLFLVALMDRWVMLVMSARTPAPNIYTNKDIKYGLCFSIIYFCFGALLLDTALYKYWGFRDNLSTEKLRNYEHALQVTAEGERQRKEAITKALTDIMGKLLVLFGIFTILVWLFCFESQTIIVYFLYIFGYTCAIIFQFNRCFTTNVATHVSIIICSAAVGFVVGVVLHAIPATCEMFWIDVAAQNVAGILAAGGTSLWAWKDWTASSVVVATEKKAIHDEPSVNVQRKVMATIESEKQMWKSNLPQAFIKSTIYADGSSKAQEITSLLNRSLNEPNRVALHSEWSTQLLEVANQMWASGRLTVAVLSRQHFIEAGFEDYTSFSFSTDGQLHVAACFVGESDKRFNDTRPLLATIISEALLYHIAASELKLSPAQCVQAEHMLFGSQYMSRRIMSEIVLADAETLHLVSRKTWMEVMKQLCLDTDVDGQWDELPQPVRQVILDRIDGHSSSLTPAFIQWAHAVELDLEAIDFHVGLAQRIHQSSGELLRQVVVFNRSSKGVDHMPAELKPVPIRRGVKTKGFFPVVWRLISTVPFVFVKWVAIITGAGSNMERELHYCFRGLPLESVILWPLLLILKACWYVKNAWVYWLLIYHRPTVVNITRLAKKGAQRKIKKNSVLVELTRSSVTGFASTDDTGTMLLRVFNGSLTEAPEKGEPLFTGHYDEDCRLRVRTDTGAGTSTYNYDEERRSRRPYSKETLSANMHTVGYYDKYGRIVRGSLSLDGTNFAFQYYYKSTPKGNSDVLRADFVLAGTENCMLVFWGKPVDPEDYTWVPSKNVSLIVKKIDGKTYTTEYDYQHRRDPVITTFLEEGDGRRTALTHPPALSAHEALLLAPPKNHSFDLDDLLIYHRPLQVRQMVRHSKGAPGFLSNLNPLNWIASYNRRTYRPVPTWRIRTELWSKWLKTNELDAITACWVDELILREEPILRPYWRHRDAGRLEAAERYLNEHINQIVSSIDIETDVSEVSLLAIKTADLYVMGLGKDACPVTTRPQDCYNDTKDRISVIFNDIGCWPMAPGGVSNCRRDLVNGHSTIRNHVLAECANDYGIPRFQVEKNVQSLKLLPLWGLDGGTANHGIMSNLLESQVDEKVDDTDIQRDIVGTFVPLIMDFVKGARMKRYSRSDLVKLSNVVLSMAKYYEHKDYTRTWKSKEVEQAWIAAWLVPYNDPNIAEPSEAFEISRPSMFDFRQSLNIYLAYFFIFAVKVPDECPRVFQSTHHGISSLFGMVLKYRRGVTFGIWDHAILWRECCLNISPAQSELPVSVQSMLLAGIGLATRIAYFHTDVVMPCASLFNPMWEAEIGSDGSRLCSRNLFRRKIDPIVNGISNMDAYNPVDKIRTDKPTVVMLSNVQMIKGVKSAIQAADIIINRFGFTDYQLVIYGAKDRQPAYALEMERLIVENKLTGKVVLAGFGNSKEVLKDAWLFMNSSISEGLPLAIGEAALAGVPIVATEVGATALVLTDPENPEQRYGEVVPPNDPLALARAQISMLSMVGPWAKFTDQDSITEPNMKAPELPDDITPSDIDWLTKRFYERAEDRRKLGLLSREVVLHSFHGSRYLREHEQMYWIQWHMAKMRDDPQLQADPFRFGYPEQLRYSEEEDEKNVTVVDDGTSSMQERTRSVTLAQWRQRGATPDVEKTAGARS